MAAYIELYVDTYNAELVSSADNRRTVAPPRFTQGDTISFRVYLLARVGDGFEIINNAALSLKMALGPKNGTAGSTLYTQQFTWTPDGQNQYFAGTLPLNTAAIETLLGTSEEADAWFEIEFVQDGLPSTALQKKIRIHAEVIESASLTTPAGETPISLEYANAAFLKAENTGFVIVNPTTGAKVQVYVGDDGAFHADPIA